MTQPVKSRKEILQKLGIEQLNEMQEKAISVIPKNNEIILLSPTGSGKTLAFLLPLLDELKPLGRLELFVFAGKTEAVEREM